MKHASPKRRSLPFVSIPVVGALIAVGAALPSFSDSYDVSGQALSFDQGKLNGAGSLVTQAAGSETAGEVIGENATVGTYVDYYNVITLDGQQIDARVKVTELVDSEGTSGTADQLEYIDEPDSSPSEANDWLNVRLDYQNGEGNSYVGMEISFFTDLASTPVAASLENLKMSTYDLDSYQYLELDAFDRYSFATTTNLEAQSVRSSFTRFIDITGESTSGTDSRTIARTTVEFDEVSVINIRLGKVQPTGTSDTGSSAYELDFSVGQAWDGLQAAPVVSPNVDPGTPSVKYSGPKGITTDLDSYCSGDLVTLSGTNLDKISNISVAGERLEVITSESNTVQFRIPDTDAQKLDIMLGVVNANVNLRLSILLRECQSSESINNAKKYASKLFSNYGGDNGELTSIDAIQIETFLGQFGSLEKVTCLGSTSGVPAIATDAALATSRAENACDLVTSKFGDGVETRITYKTGVGVGQKFRSVRIFAVGTAK